MGPDLGSARCLWAAAGAVAALALLAVGVPACAVSPTDDCSAKARCAAAGVGLPDGTRSGGDMTDASGHDAAARSDGRDAAPGPPDSKGDSDVASNEAGAPREDDGAAAPPVDTIAAACGLGFECAAPLPRGWSGPLALWWSNANDPPPPCPPGYAKPVDVGNDLVAPAATCASSCTATGQQCSASVSLYADAHCMSECGTDQNLSDGTCTPVIGCSGQAGTLMADPGVPAGGACVPSVRASIAPPSWASPARLCTATGAPPLGLCPNASAPCVPTPAAPYTGLPCVVLVLPQGAPPPTSCPSAYPFGPTVYYPSIVDTRGCSPASCAAGGPTGGSCAGTIAVTGAAASDCASWASPYPIGSGCSQPFTLDSPMAHVRATLTVAPGSCSVGTEGRPVGSARPSGPPSVICCM